MAERKIVWSARARNQRYKILEFLRNKSKTYSVKLNKRINEELDLLCNYPRLGIKTDIPNVRGLIIDHFILFYEVDRKTIVVHHIWDSRQDPEQLRII